MASSRAQALKSLMESIHANTTDDTMPEGAAPPPTYEETINDIDYDDDYSPDSQNDDYVEPHYLQVDASTSVSGSGNVIHADFIASTGAKAAAAICAFLKEQERQHSQAALSNIQAGATTQGTPPRPRPVRIGLNISVRIAGGRNLIACPSNMRPSQSSPTSPTVTVPQSTAEEPRSQPGSQQAAAEVATTTEPSASTQMPRPQSRSQQAAEQDGPVTNEAEVARSESLNAQASSAVQSDPSLSMTGSADDSRKRKARDDDEYGVDVDTDVPVEARKRSRVAGEPQEESLGGAD